VRGVAVGVPADPFPSRLLEVLQAAPNPIRNDAAIRFSYALSKAATLTLDLFDVTGRRVASRSRRATAGTGTLEFRSSGTPSHLASGVYLARITAAAIDGSSASWKSHLVVIK
jgi:hypothetical protein